MHFGLPFTRYDGECETMDRDTALPERRNESNSPNPKREDLSERSRAFLDMLAEAHRIGLTGLYERNLAVLVTRNAHASLHGDDLERLIALGWVLYKRGEYSLAPHAETLAEPLPEGLTLSRLHSAWRGCLSAVERRLLDRLIAIRCLGKRGIKESLLVSNAGYGSAFPEAARAVASLFDRGLMVSYRKGYVRPTDMLFPPGLD